MMVHGTPPPERFNFAQSILERNVARASKAAYIDDAETLSYGDLETRVRSAAAAYLALGLHREERVFLCLQDTVDFPIAFLGALYAGIVPVAVNTMLTADDFAYMLTHSRAQALMVSEGLLPVLQQALARGGHDVLHVIVSRSPAPLHGRAARKRAGFFFVVAISKCLVAACEYVRRRNGLLALLVRVDRTSEGDGTYARQPLLDCCALWRSRPRTWRERCRVFRSQTVLCLRPRQCADVSAVCGRNDNPDGGKSNAAGCIQAIGRTQADDILWRADSLRRHAGVARIAGARCRDAASMHFRRRSAAARSGREICGTFRMRNSGWDRLDRDAAHLPVESPR